MGKYQAYPEYKDSKVSGLGSIPSLWEVMQLKRTVDGCVNGIWGSEPKKDGHDTIVLRVADFDRPKLSLQEDGYTYRKIEDKEKITRKLKCGDLLLEKSGGGEKTLVGQVVLFDKDFEAVTSNFVAKMTPNEGFNSRFLNYVFSRFYSENINYCSIKQNTGIQNLDSAAYLSGKFGFPIEEEQNKIATFLDHETVKIDTLIEKQQQLIKLLKEKRQAVISHAVTKGLPSPTGAKVPMRDSGVEWLGEVPAHWVSCALKHYARVVDCKHITAEFFDDGIPLASISEVKEWHVNLATAKFTNEKYYLDLIGGGRKPELGDIIYSRNATVGEAALVTEGMPKFAMGQDVCLIRLDEDILPEYLLYVLKSGVISNQLDLVMVGSTFKRINVDDIRSFSIAFPTYDEQIAIVAELARILGKYDALVSNAEATIGLMTERRTALISAAVTGKIDVRNWVAPEPSTGIHSKAVSL